MEAKIWGAKVARDGRQLGNYQKGKEIALYPTASDERNTHRIELLLNNIDTVLGNAGIASGPEVAMDRKLPGSQYFYYRTDCIRSDGYLSAGIVETWVYKGIDAAIRVAEDELGKEKQDWKARAAQKGLEVLRAAKRNNQFKTVDNPYQTLPKDQAYNPFGMRDPFSFMEIGEMRDRGR